MEDDEVKRILNYLSFEDRRIIENYLSVLKESPSVMSIEESRAYLFPIFMDFTGDRLKALCALKKAPHPSLEQAFIECLPLEDRTKGVIFLNQLKSRPIREREESMQPGIPNLSIGECVSALLGAFVVGVLLMGVLVALA